MHIDQTRKGKIICLTFSGPTNGTLTRESEESIRDALKEEKSDLLIDLCALGYLRSAVLRVILDVAKETKRKNGKVVLCTLNEYVREIFEISGIGAILPIADSVESGLDSLSSGTTDLQVEFTT